MENDLIHRYVIAKEGGDLEFTQQELTLGQMQKLVDVFSGLDLAVDPANPMTSLMGLSFKKLFDALQQKSAIVAFFSTILKCNAEYTPDDLLAMPYTMIRQVVLDFLALNAGLISDLTGLLSFTSSKNPASVKGDRSVSAKSSTTSAAVTSPAEPKLKAR